MPGSAAFRARIALPAPIRRERSCVREATLSIADARIEMPDAVRGSSVPYPALAMLNACSPTGITPSFELEAIACALIDAFCSDHVWTTGHISPETLRVILSRLSLAAEGGIASPMTTPDSSSESMTHPNLGGMGLGGAA